MYSQHLSGVFMFVHILCTLKKKKSSKIKRKATMNGCSFQLHFQRALRIFKMLHVPAQAHLLRQSQLHLLRQAVFSEPAPLREISRDFIRPERSTVIILHNICLYLSRLLPRMPPNISIFFAFQRHLTAFNARASSSATHPWEIASLYLFHLANILPPLKTQRNTSLVSFSSGPLISLSS